MTPRQTKFYWQMWKVVSTARKTKDRHAWHEQVLGRTVSSKDLTDADYDKLKADFLSITKPDSVTAQMRQIAMPQIRGRKAVELVAAAMDRDQAWIESIVAQASRQRKFAVSGRGPGAAAQFETLTPQELTVLLWMVKDNAARQWREEIVIDASKPAKRKPKPILDSEIPVEPEGKPTYEIPSKPVGRTKHIRTPVRYKRKEPLLAAMSAWLRENEVDGNFAHATACKVLATTGPVQLGSLKWDDLIIVFGAWKQALRGELILHDDDFGTAGADSSAEAAADPEYSTEELTPF